MGVHRTCGEPNEIELAPHWGVLERPAARTYTVVKGPCSHPSVAVNSVAFGSLHVLRAPMGVGCIASHVW